MSYRTTKKAYTRKFGKPEYVRDTTVYTVNVEPNKETYVKKASSVNRQKSGYLMRKALYERKPIAVEDVKKLNTETSFEPTVVNLKDDYGDLQVKLLLRSGYRGPVSA
ncbi:MAG: hypothetical protein SO096_05685 [Prevotella sp.]|nr:hypothetical protein [Bacteroidales bacterium]MDY4955940.1 hypothetical protein [Prevotella sp.]